MIDFLGRIFGPLTGLISSVLELLHSLGTPWWLSIVLVTVLVRAVLSPLTIRQVKNVRAMQELRPEIEKVRSRYKDDLQKQQEALAELYRERRLNPLAGFVPVLVQMPVFVTMYKVIRYHEETLQSFAHGGLFWFTDLTRADPYFILPVLSASILILSGMISSRNTDPTQQRMVLFLPLVFTAFIVRLPAGLFVYWITSNAFTLVHNYLIYHHGPGRTASPPSRSKAEEKPSGRGGGGSRALANGASNRSRKSTGGRRKRNRRK